MNWDPILQTLSPSATQVASVFDGLARMDSDLLNLLLQALDPEVITKLAQWSGAFVEKINEVKQVREQSAGEPRTITDFEQMMGGTQFVGDRLTWAEMTDLNNRMVKAIKSANWQDAILMGVNLAKMGIL